jgi:hypothetical protein
VPGRYALDTGCFAVFGLSQTNTPCAAPPHRSHSLPRGERQLRKTMAAKIITAAGPLSTKNPETAPDRAATYCVSLTSYEMTPPTDPRAQ